MSGPRIGVYGLLGSGNIGNDGTFDVMVDHLRDRRPDAVIDVFTDSPEGVARRWGLPATRMHWNRHEYETAARPGAALRKGVGKLIDAVRIAAWVRRHDIVLMAGMGAFEATLPLRAWGTPYSQFLLCTLARRFGVRTAWVSVGAGGTVDRATRALFVGAARRVTYLSYRDEQSRDAMRAMGLRARGDLVYPDLVFGLDGPPASAERTGVTAVGVLDFHGDNADRGRADEVNAEYVAKLHRLVGRLLDDGRDVRLVVGDRSDERVAALIVDDVRAHRPEAAERLHADPVPTLQELQRQLAGVDTVVATRFHNVLCALKLARPTVSIGYAAKNDALMTDMGLGGYCHRAATFDPDVVYRQIGELESRHTELSAAMARRSMELRALVDEQFAVLDGVLFDGSSASLRMGVLPESG